MKTEKITVDPNKEFFIEMLTRDIKLERAILDLIDNSIDAAKSKTSEFNLKGYWVKIDISDSEIRISDNCGGISKYAAKNYAFNFGRPNNTKTNSNYSIGRFGIGMKRALFKLGNYFLIETHTGIDNYFIEVDVRKWKQESGWVFEYTDMQESDDKIVGTTIIVNKLHENVKKDFSLESFANNLVYQIEKAESESIKIGFNVEVSFKGNSKKLECITPKLLVSDDIKPAYMKLNYEDVEIKIWLGLGEADPNKAGWYIYCNDRLVLEANKDSTSGWGIGIPKYHNDFARFRGYVYFNSVDPIKLPLNTTKTGIDEDSSVYKSVLLEMINMGRNVMDFLRKLKKEKSNTTSSELNDIVENAKDNEISLIESSKLNSRFLLKKPKNYSPKYIQTISYKVEKSRIDIMKENMGVDSNKEVGEISFDYYYEMECE